MGFSLKRIVKRAADVVRKSPVGKVQTAIIGASVGQFVQPKTLRITNKKSQRAFDVGQKGGRVVAVAAGAYLAAPTVLAGAKTVGGKLLAAGGMKAVSGTKKVTGQDKYISIPPQRYSVGDKLLSSIPGLIAPRVGLPPDVIDADWRYQGTNREELFATPAQVEAEAARSGGGISSAWAWGAIGLFGVGLLLIMRRG